MKHRCSKCGHVDTIKPRNQVKGGKSRWAGMTKAQRSAEMKRVRAAALFSPNVEVSHARERR